MAVDTGAGGANGKGSGGAADLDTDPDGASGAGEDSVSRQTYLKTLDEAKSARRRAKAAEDRLTTLEQEKLAAEGNKDGQIQSLQKQLDDEKKTRKSLEQATVKKALNSQLTAALANAGCTKVDKALRLIDFKALGDVDGDTFEADAEAVSAAVSDLKKDVPEFFSKAGPKINTRMNKGDDDPQPDEKEDLSKLTSDQLRARLRDMRTKK